MLNKRFLYLSVMVIFLGMMFGSPDIAGAKTASLVFEDVDKFTSFYSIDGDFYDITHFTRLSDGQLMVGVRKNGEFIRQKETGDYGYLSSYFELGSIASGAYRVDWRYLNPDNQIRWSQLGYLVAPDSDITLPEEPGQDFERGNLEIYLPAQEGHKTNQDFVSLWYRYCIETPAAGSISFSVDGGTWRKPESNRTWTDGEFSFGQVNLKVGLNMGENLLSVTAVADGVTYFDDRLVIRSGFVDEDGDGWDDNTGQGWWPDPDSTDMGDGVPQPPGEDGTIFDYIKYLTDSLVYSMNQMLVMLRSFMGGLAQLGEVIRSFFSFMPPQFSAIILLGLVMAVILRVVSR